MKKDSKIYIAGHRGMVGSGIVRRFEKDGYTNLILRTRQELDLLDAAAVSDFFKNERPEYVIDSAAKVGGIKANMEHQADFLYENLQIQNNIMWSAKEVAVKKLLFLGSSCIYPLQSPQPMKEEYFMTGPPEPTNAGYAWAKIAGMELCELIQDQYKLDFISCMPTNIYGVNDDLNPESSHVIPALIQRMHEAQVNSTKEVVIWGSGKTRREFLYVDDAADAVLWLMNNYDDPQFLNVGTGEDISIKDLAFKIKDVVGYEGELVFDTTKPDGFPRKQLDVSKLTKLGWTASTPFEEGLKTTYKWYLGTAIK